MLIDSLINHTCSSKQSILLPMLSFTSSYALSLTLSLFLSLPYLALSPAPMFWYKNPGIHFQLIIDCNKQFWYTLLFHLEVAHNIRHLNTYMVLLCSSLRDSISICRHFCIFEYDIGLNFTRNFLTKIQSFLCKIPFGNMYLYSKSVCMTMYKDFPQYLQGPMS